VSHVTHCELCHTLWVMSHIISHVTHCESRLLKSYPHHQGISRKCPLFFCSYCTRRYMCDTTHSRVRVRDITHPYVWQDSFVCVTCLVICVTWLIRVRDMTCLCVWHERFVCVTCLIHTCVMTQSSDQVLTGYAGGTPFVCQGSFIFLPWLMRVTWLSRPTRW